MTLPAPQTPTENPTDRESAGGVPARGKVSVSWEGNWSVCLAFCLVACARLEHFVLPFANVSLDKIHAHLMH